VGIGKVAPRAVFLDRDGVLNHAVVREGKPYPPASSSELRLVEGARRDLDSLRASGVLLIVVTNQPDVARGKQTRQAVEDIHAVLKASLPLDDFFTCYHDDSDGCDCRKPKPGLILQASARYGIDLSRSFLIGDRWRDIDAGHAAGCAGTVWLDFGYQERQPAAPPALRTHSLASAVEWISSQLRR
jgi:D-glycero-D-manno-heptose 1,7-bisphosphate phosphatase